MPYELSNPPATIEALPKGAQRIWISVFNSTFRAYEGDQAAKEDAARRAAWSAVKMKYERGADGKWTEKNAKAAFNAGNRIIVELNEGFPGPYKTLAYTAIDRDLGIFANEGEHPETGRREPAALYFDTGLGWTVARAVAWARDYAAKKGFRLKRVGIERETTGGRLLPFHRGLLAKAVADPALAAKRIAFAEVYRPWEVDTQGEMATPEEIETACHNFMRKQVIGIQHTDWSDKESYIVENFISREGDLDFPEPGTWVMGVKWSAKAWQMILNDELTGVSFGGSWNRVPAIHAEQPQGEAA